MAARKKKSGMPAVIKREAMSKEAPLHVAKLSKLPTLAGDKPPKMPKAPATTIPAAHVDKMPKAPAAKMAKKFHSIKPPKLKKG